MKALLKKIDEWAAKAIKFIRPGKHKTSNVLTDNVHLKEKRIVDVEDEGLEREKIVAPEEYYVTREGQLMRKPDRKKYYYRHKYKFIKRSK